MHISAAEGGDFEIVFAEEGDMIDEGKGKKEDLQEVKPKGKKDTA